MSLDHLNNNLGKKCILEGARKGIESKQFFIVAKFFHFEKKKTPTTSTKDVFEKNKSKFAKFRKIVII
jgi:hypothetical protein